jgi:Acyl-CoA carboxylase epsilon subunit
MAMPPESPARPLLSIVRGDPTPAELAAVLVVLAARARSAASTAGARQSRSQWSAPTRMMRPQLARGAGAWRASGLPR